MFREKSGILMAQSGSNEEKLMLRQSLWITRQLPCDTLLNPERGQMTCRRLKHEPSDFLMGRAAAVKAAALFFNSGSNPSDSYVC